jgi:AcrR family transcriptional regulator
MGPQYFSPAATRQRGRPRKGEFERPLKDLLVDATLAVVSSSGTTDASARKVADVVGVQPASINYNFGSWNELVAQAALKAYHGYSERIWTAALSAPETPAARLTAFLREQLAWADEESGWAAFFNFPKSAQTASDILFSQFGEEMRQGFEVNYGRLYRLVRDVKEGVVTKDPDWMQKTGRDAILADTEVLTETIVVSWTSLGMQIWGSRHQADQLGGDHLRDYNARAQDLAIEKILASLTG